jgi:hypothetical protein
MAWIKRNLFFVIGGMLALGLLGAAGYYNYKGWSHNQAALKQLTEIQNTLRDYATRKLQPGNEKIDNLKAAKEQEGRLQAWIRNAGDYFKPITPIPNTGTNAVSSDVFAGALRRTIDQMQRDAETASVMLPPRYGFSFDAERQLLKFDPSGLGPLAEELGEVKAIVGVLFAARVNSLDGIQRVRVSADDLAGSQADYYEGRSVTNNLAVLTPYQITFRSFTPEVGEVLSRFASSPHGFYVKSLNVQPAGAFAASGGGGGGGVEGMPPGWRPPQPMLPPLERAPLLDPMPAPLHAPMQAPMPMLPAEMLQRRNTPQPAPTSQPGVAPPGRGGLQTVLNEQLLRVTLVVEVVKLLPKN